MTLYSDLLAAGCKLDSHESDLYVEATSTARMILANHGKTVDGHNVQSFISQVDGLRWLDIPFAFDPWYERRKESAS